MNWQKADLADPLLRAGDSQGTLSNNPSTARHACIDQSSALRQSLVLSYGVSIVTMYLLTERT